MLFRLLPCIFLVLSSLQDFRNVLMHFKENRSFRGPPFFIGRFCFRLFCSFFLRNQSAQYFATSFLVRIAVSGLLRVLFRDWKKPRLLLSSPTSSSLRFSQNNPVKSLRFFCGLFFFVLPITLSDYYILQADFIGGESIFPAPFFFPGSSSHLRICPTVLRFLY